MNYESEPRVFALARILLGVMLCWAPLPFGAVYTWAWASLSILTLLILILWMVGSLQRGNLTIGYTPLYLPLAGFLALGMTQLFIHLTITPIATKESMLKLVTYSVLFFVVIQLFVDSPAETWRRAGIAVLAFGFIFSFLSILQFFWNPARILWVDHDLGASFGPYVDRDHYAGLMELIIPISAAYVLSRPKHDPLGGGLWFGVLVPVVSLLLTGSRGGLVSILLEAALLGWVVVWRNPLPERRMRVVLAGGALLAIATVFAWLVPSYVAGRLGSIHTYAPEIHSGYRQILWKGSLGILGDHPLAGTGLGSFATVYPRHQLEVSDLTSEHAHNDFIETTVEAGLPGFLLILLALVCFFPAVFGGLFPQLQREPGWIQLGAGISCCGLMAHSFVDFNLHIPANAVWFVFCAGLASISGRVPASRVS